MTIDDVLEEFRIGDVRCGAECGDGWVPLVRELIQDLIAMGWDRDLHQVKQKLGGLRFYVGAASDEIYDTISLAETKSRGICEYCGGVGRGRTLGGWLCVLCAACFKKEETRWERS